jgi:hypothetical protein
MGRRSERISVTNGRILRGRRDDAHLHRDGFREM